MSPLCPGGSRHHKIKYEREDEYVISWTTYIKHGRLLWPVGRSRDTDRRGAERFAKKWNVAMPTIPEGRQP